MGTYAGGFPNLWIWDRVRDRMAWYLAVATNRMPAKYILARRVGCDVDLRADEEALWQEHTRLTGEFLCLLERVREGEESPDLPRPAEPSLLDLSVELVRRTLRRCDFCRWNCRVNREEGRKRGTCQLDAVSRVSSYFHHLGEELVFRGTRGSGTVFFTSCCLKCQFCQNGDISRDRENGIPVSPRELAAIARQLRLEGCHNINWVGGEPTIHLHTIVEAIRLVGDPSSADDLTYVESVKADTFRLFRERIEDASYAGELNAPMLWNSNMFMSAKTMRILRPLIDVWLPDFKFGNDRCALFLARTPWYFDTVSRNHQILYEWDEDLVIRHLVMPGHVDCCTRPVLSWISEHMPRALVNVMDQYHPDSACDPGSERFDPRYGSVARRPTRGEIQEAYACARHLGLRFEDVTFEKASRGLRP